VTGFTRRGSLQMKTRQLTHKYNVPYQGDHSGHDVKPDNSVMNGFYRLLCATHSNSLRCEGFLLRQSIVLSKQTKCAEQN
jgi:hypothetical protein